MEFYDITKGGVSITPNQIPENIDIKIEQQGKEYVIYAKLEEPISLDMHSILIQLK